MIALARSAGTRVPRYKERGIRRSGRWFVWKTGRPVCPLEFGVSLSLVWSLRDLEGCFLFGPPVFSMWDMMNRQMVI